MRDHSVGLSGIGILLILCSACSEIESETTDAGFEASSIEERVEEIAGNSPAAANRYQSLARLEDCELSSDMENRLIELEEKLNELLLRFVEQHPDVI